MRSASVCPHCRGSGKVVGKRPPGVGPDGMYKKEEIVERHRHRYEVNPEFRDGFNTKGMNIVGTSVDDMLVEMIEIQNHPWFLGCQFHPEFTSNPRDGHPIFNSFISSTIKTKK